MTTMIPPMCLVCTRRQGDFTCTPFPDGIPDAILYDYFDHRQPFIGDGGLRFVSDGSEVADIIIATYDEGPIEYVKPE